jgi:hypothetical protein
VTSVDCQELAIAFVDPVQCRERSGLSGICGVDLTLLGSFIFPNFLTACAVGFILSPLRGFGLSQHPLCVRFGYDTCSSLVAFVRLFFAEHRLGSCLNQAAFRVLN